MSNYEFHLCSLVVGYYYILTFTAGCFIYNSDRTFISEFTDWASEASPTLGCSIKISHDIYMYVYMCVCRGPKSVGGITWVKRTHAQSQYWAVKSDQ